MDKDVEGMLAECEEKRDLLSWKERDLVGRAWKDLHRRGRLHPDDSRMLAQAWLRVCTQDLI